MSGVAGIVGLGITKNGFSLEVTNYSSFYPTAQGLQGVTALSLSYRIPIR